MTAATCPTAPLVNAAHPVTTYGTGRERDFLARLAALVTPAQVVDPAARYRSSVDWLSDWPGLLPTLTGLVVFADADGTIGAGCLRELTDAWRLGLPTALLDDHGDLRHVSNLRILPPRCRTGLRMAVVVGGRRFNLAAACDQLVPDSPTKGGL
jgi:hypothetical protein